MNARLLALSEIPYQGRASERAARARHPSRAAALEAACYRIEAAPGCHGEPAFAPPVYGWVLSRAAAVAVSTETTTMPDGTHHRRVTYSHIDET